MPDLVDHAAYGRNVLQFDSMVDSPEPQPPHDVCLTLVKPDGASHQLHLHTPGLRSFRHHTVATRLLKTAAKPTGLSCLLSPEGASFYAVKSFGSTPRNRAMATGSLSSTNPVKVARTTLCGLSVPSDLVRMF